MHSCFSSLSDAQQVEMSSREDRSHAPSHARESREHDRELKGSRVIYGPAWASVVRLLQLLLSPVVIILIGSGALGESSNTALGFAGIILAFVAPAATMAYIVWLGLSSSVVHAAYSYRVNIFGEFIVLCLWTAATITLAITTAQMARANLAKRLVISVAAAAGICGFECLLSLLAFYALHTAKRPPRPRRTHHYHHHDRAQDLYHDNRPVFSPVSAMVYPGQDPRQFTA